MNTNNPILLLSTATSSPRFKILESALRVDAKLYVVGGSVRDAVLGIPPEDLDLATALPPDEVRNRLEKSNIRVAPTGLKHQTVLAVPELGAEGVEITTFRGAQMRPEGGVCASLSIEEDLRYRDFTINALAFDPRTKKIIDPFDGMAAISNKQIVAVGNPEDRFAEDPLRVMRMVRFACTLNFEIEKQTFTAARKFRALLGSVSIERIRDEFSLILTSALPSKGISLLQELNFLEVFLPEISRFYGFEQNSFHQWDLFTHTLKVIEGTSPNLVLRLAALFHDVGKPDTLTIDDEKGERHFYLHDSVGARMTYDILTRLRYPNDTIEAVVNLVKIHMRPLSMGAGGLRRLLRDSGELFSSWRELKIADTLATKAEPGAFAAELSAFDENIEKVKEASLVHPFAHLAIGGKDLISLGLTPGPHFGDILRALQERVLENPLLNDRDTLLRIISTEFIARTPAAE